MFSTKALFYKTTVQVAPHWSGHHRSLLFSEATHCSGCCGTSTVIFHTDYSCEQLLKVAVFKAQVNAELLLKLQTQSRVRDKGGGYSKHSKQPLPWGAQITVLNISFKV